MKAPQKNLFFIPLLVATFGLLLSGQTNAQTFTTLHSFSATPPPNGFNVDGAFPNGSLVLSGATLYGTAQRGGADDMGTVFKINTDGTGFSSLFSFTGASDGLYPSSGLILSGSTLYGTSLDGGQQFSGSIFSGSTSGSGYSALVSFISGGGTVPFGQLILSGGIFYGTTYTNGSTLNGTLFKVGSGGGNYVNLHNFTSTILSTNKDGANPYAGMVINGATLYGVATYGGASGYGTIFKINTDGSAFTTLHSFSVDSDGAFPIGGLVLSNNVLYGTTEEYGPGGYGTVFKMNTDGTGFTVLYGFSGDDGAYPQSTLILSTNMLYGCTIEGGTAGNGVIFGVNTNGTGFTNVHSFSAFSSSTTNNTDGANPFGALIQSGNTLYGACTHGGALGNGTVFKVTVPPQTNGHPAFFTGEVALANNVYYLTFSTNLFGYYTYAYFPYLYHFDLGFEYFIDANDSSHGAYLYDFASGHFWYTSPTFPFPYLYDFTLNTVIYYFPDSTNSGHYTTNPRYFINTANQHIFTQ